LKCALGLLDADWADQLAGLEAAARDTEDLDPPEHRALARRLAEESVVVLDNDGTLPLPSALDRLALVGPLADDVRGMLGCYTFDVHVGAHHPEVGMGVSVPTLAEALRAELGSAAIAVERGCGVDASEDTGDVARDDEAFDAAVQVAAAAHVAVLALGDRSGLFGRGTSGEGSDASTLLLPGRQAELADAVLATGTPTIIVLLSGRPYALGGLAERAAAVVQTFFAGEEGAGAIAGVLTGRVEPSGRLPVSVPRDPGGQPATYLRAYLGGRTDVSSVDPTPLYPFGHGLTWTRFSYGGLEVGPANGGDAVPTDGAARVAVTVRNDGDRAGTEVVQLYLHDPVASVVRPLRWLAGWARVRLAPGQSAHVEFTVHADRTSFTGVDMRRIVEPGRIDVAVGSSSEDLRLHGAFELVGPRRVLGRERVLTVPARVDAG
jgi:hypothetical protein